MPASLAVAQPRPGAGCDRQIKRPAWPLRHQTGEFFGAAKVIRHFSNNFVVYVQHDRIAGSFDSQHRLCQQIAGNSGNDVFCPQSGVSTVAVAALAELPVGAVRKHHRAVLGVEQLRPGKGVGELSTAWQLQEQEIAVALKSGRPAAHDAAALLHGIPSGLINGVPELAHSRVCSTPFGLDSIPLLLAEHSRRKLLDSLLAALIAARQITGFAESTLTGA